MSTANGQAGELCAAEVGAETAIGHCLLPWLDLSQLGSSLARRIETQLAKLFKKDIFYRAIGVVTAQKGINDLGIRRYEGHARAGYLTGILFVGKPERCDDSFPICIREDRKRKSQLLHDCRVHRHRVGTDGKHPSASIEEFLVSICHDGQLAVAIASEVAALEGEHRRRVEVIGQPPWLARRVLDREIDGHALVLLSIAHCYRLAVMFIPISGRNLRRRIVQLNIGLVLFGLGIAFMLRSELGLPPWDVLHQGLAEQFGLTVGIWSIIISFVVLLLWLPLRERYGIGTVLNAIVIGVVIDLGSLVIPEPASVVIEVVMLAGGILLIGLASGMYIGANLGPGPRDGLMTAVARRGPSIRATRWGLEIVVLISGFLLGGTFGVGTIAFALFIGPLVQFFLPRWSIDTGRPEDAWDHPAR